VELEQAAEARRLVALAARQTPDSEACESLVPDAARRGGSLGDFAESLAATRALRGGLAGLCR